MPGGRHGDRRQIAAAARRRHPEGRRRDAISGPSRLSAPIRHGRTIALGLLAIAYLAAGVLHVADPGPFLRITPGWVPWPAQVILLTGLCEIAGAIGLVIPRTRRLAGVMLALYAICVIPANVNHALMDLGSGHGLGLGYHLPRLLAQPLIVWWALFAGEVTVWPFARRLQDS